MTYRITVTVEFDSKHYDDVKTIKDAENLVRAAITGEADWPKVQSVKACASGNIEEIAEAL